MKLLGMPDDELERVLVDGAVLEDERNNARFQVGDLVARGGMGEVYRAVRLNDGALCALKCVRADLVRDAKILLRTRHEVHASSLIAHPNVVRVHGTGAIRDKIPWMAMEWLEGWTLQQVLDQRGRLPVRWAVEITRDVCRGLRAIHEFAVHRDVKPSNIHLGKDGVTRVIDLGAALPHERDVRLTSTGYQIGTLPFMAPEQVDDAMGCDHRCDLWAATAVFYMLMTGQHPLAIKGRLPAVPFQLARRIVMEPHQPLLDLLPGAPPFFGEIIDTGLEKHRDDRYASAADMVKVLSAALAWLEDKSGHAEPLTSLVAQLAGKVEPVAVAPPELAWAPKPAVDDERSAPKPPLKDVATPVAAGIFDADAATIPRMRSLHNRAKGTEPMGVQSVAGMSPATYAAALATISPAAPAVASVRALPARTASTAARPRQPQQRVEPPRATRLAPLAVSLVAALVPLAVAWLSRARWLPLLELAPAVTAIDEPRHVTPVTPASAAAVAAASTASGVEPSAPSVAGSVRPVAPKPVQPYRSPQSRPAPPLLPTAPLPSRPEPLPTVIE